MYSMFKHVKTGRWYRIKSFAIEEATLKTLVVYENVLTEEHPFYTTWTRPAEEFFDGRFTLI